MILTELGYQAGQHEVLADVFMKDIPQEIKLQMKNSQRQVENHRKDIKLFQTRLDKAYKDLEKSKRKYVKHHKEWEFSKEALNQAKYQSTPTKQELDKLQQICLNKEQQVDDYKGEYAQQLVKTNQEIVRQQDIFRDLMANGGAMDEGAMQVQQRADALVTR